MTISHPVGRRGHCRSLSTPSPRTGGAAGTPLAIFGGGAAAAAAAAAAIAEHAAVYRPEPTTWGSLASSLEPRLASHAAATEHARPAATSRTDGATSPACMGASSSRAATFSGSTQAPHGAAGCVVPQQPAGAATLHPASPRHLSLPHHERFALCGSPLACGPAASPAAGRRVVPRPTGIDGTAVTGRGGAAYTPRVQPGAPAASRGSPDTIGTLDPTPAPPFACGVSCGVGPGNERPDRSLSVGSPRCACQGAGAGGGGGGGGSGGGGGFSAATERLDRSVSVGSPRCACQGASAPTSKKLGVGLLVGAGLLDGLVEGLVPAGAAPSASIADGLVGRRYARSRVHQRDPGLPCGSPVTLRKIDTAPRADTDSQ